MSSVRCMETEIYTLKLTDTELSLLCHMGINCIFSCKRPKDFLSHILYTTCLCIQIYFYPHSHYNTAIFQHCVQYVGQYAFVLKLHSSILRLYQSRKFTVCEKQKYATVHPSSHITFKTVHISNTTTREYGDHRKNRLMTPYKEWVKTSRNIFFLQ